AQHPAVRNFREGDGDVGIIRSPVRAISPPDRSADRSLSVMGSITYLFVSYMGNFVTLPRGALAARCTRVARSVEHMARAVRGVLHARGAARRVSSVSARIAERQSAEIDERDARARQRSRDGSGPSALSHACAVEGRPRVAKTARGRSRTPWGVDPRLDQFSEAGSTLRRRR